MDVSLAWAIVCLVLWVVLGILAIGVEGVSYTRSALLIIWVLVGILGYITLGAKLG